MINEIVDHKTTTCFRSLMLGQLSYVLYSKYHMVYHMCSINKDLLMSPGLLITDLASFPPSKQDNARAGVMIFKRKPGERPAGDVFKCSSRLQRSL